MMDMMDRFTYGFAFCYFNILVFNIFNQVYQYFKRLYYVLIKFNCYKIIKYKLLKKILIIQEVNHIFKIP